MRIVCMGGRPEWISDLCEIVALVAPSDYKKVGEQTVLGSHSTTWKNVRTFYGCKIALYRTIRTLKKNRKLYPYQSIRQMTEERKVPLFVSTQLRSREFIELLRIIKPDLIVSTSIDRIIPPDVLSIPPLGCITIHAGTLPVYRGAHTLTWSIKNGEKATSINTIYMDKEVDTGDIIYNVEVKIDTQRILDGSFLDDIEAISRRLLRRTIIGIEKGVAPRCPQPNQVPRNWGVPKSEDFRLIWNLPFDEIYNLWLASVFYGRWPIYTYHHKEKFNIRGMSLIANSSSDFNYGSVISVTPIEKQLVVNSKSGVVSITCYSDDININISEYFEKFVKVGDNLA